MIDEDLSTLIVGCSFVQNLTQPGYKINQKKWITKGSSGSGNQAIAARVLHECAQEDYKEVIILWSGINRLDFPIGIPYHRTMLVDSSGNPKYGYYVVLDDVVWYHSGGWGSSGCLQDSPQWFRNWCQVQYKSSSQKYLTDLTLQSIIQTQSFLKSQRIPYRMSFIYNIDVDYKKNHNKLERYIEPGCGKIDRSSSLIDLVDWTTFTTHKPPYEFAHEIDQLEDGFHPRFSAMNEWFKRAFSIDLTA